MAIRSTLITVSPTARILKVAEGTVRGMVRRGELPCIFAASGLRLFDRETIERIAAEREGRADGHVHDPDLDATGQTEAASGDDDVLRSAVAESTGDANGDEPTGTTP